MTKLILLLLFSFIFKFFALKQNIARKNTQELPKLNIYYKTVSISSKTVRNLLVFGFLNKLFGILCKFFFLFSKQGSGSRRSLRSSSRRSPIRIRDPELYYKACWGIRVDYLIAYIYLIETSLTRKNCFSFSVKGLSHEIKMDF